MFINDVISKMREPISQKYEEIYKASCELNENELYEKILAEIRSINLVSMSSGLGMTLLATSGCPHNIRNGKFSGCSMCDFNSEYVNQLAMMAVLKQKNQYLYGKAMRYSFEYHRGIGQSPEVAELMTGYDTLNPEEISDEAFDELLNKGDIFKSKPYKSIFETRACNVSYDRLMKWKDKLGRKVVVEFGVEVGNEWIRNHWLNKNINNEDIENAVKAIRAAKCESIANILVGIPGLTEAQCIELFKDTFLWLCDLGVDHILCSPLSLRKVTLQSFIRERLIDNDKLKSLGIIHGEATGIPYIFTLFEAIYSVATARDDAKNIMKFSLTNFPYYQEDILLLNKDNPAMVECINDTILALTKFVTYKDLDGLKNARNRLMENNEYQSYLDLLEKQKAAGSLSQTIYSVGHEIAKLLWPEDCDKRTAALSDELSSL